MLSMTFRYVSPSSSVWSSNNPGRLKDVMVKSLLIHNIAAPPQTIEHDTPPSPLPHSQDYTESYDGIQQHPVQETDPAPQECEDPQVSETTHPEDVRMAEDDAKTLPGSA
ncbi:hypothetical protein CHARACLAT_006384 [Characodon lateralis]|uniref:Uncharacterized protein n=1 Tax=Characodon lateralis TaxID=208331 RepID=A0ABU7E082_9TELE|nr:hypothetical protein [Characodon lateralis]